MKINGIVGKNLKWFKNYLNNRKQYIQINIEEKTNLQLVKCGIPKKKIENLKKVSSQEKHAMRIIRNKGKIEHTKHLFQSNKILIVL